ncbi:MAG TPA: TetR/AcrR family transcriptional regulator [Solirubrobacteraceae bacterium]|nr:TetR/AcrR family transcriptional regulator [Solirubrobacteraceae bacterium]
MPKLKPETRVARHNELIDAAWRCAARSGFRDLTVDDVCAEAGVSKGAFYGYFKQKDELLIALLDDDADALDGKLSQIAKSEGSAVERLRRFTRVVLQHGSDPGRVQVRADLWAELLTAPPVRDRVAATTDRRRSLVRGWIDAGIASGELTEIPANALSSILLALADGLVLHRVLDPGGFRWVNISRAVEVLLAGLASHAAPEGTA